MSVACCFTRHFLQNNWYTLWRIVSAQTRAVRILRGSRRESSRASSLEDGDGNCSEGGAAMIHALLFPTVSHRSLVGNGPKELARSEVPTSMLGSVSCRRRYDCTLPWVYHRCPGGYLAPPASHRRGHLRSPRLFIVGPVFTTPDRHPVGTMARGNTQLQEKIAGQVTVPEITRVADHREGIAHLKVIVSAFRSLFAIILGNSS